ncbi:MAG: hypothetical protein H6621_00335 [Halobacteriovoraceae bacterium]|nr:hypothetical protein [Halobacteriovoraceae bacterium]MCB9093486.1 hypothetical protein [Halobacteriovoraceae bacterium]
MLRVILISLFTFSLVAHGNEPGSLLVVFNGQIKEVSFSKLTQVEISAINYHPKFKEQGETKYKGYLIKDILKNIAISPDQYVTVVGKTGQFSIELKISELMANNNLIATHINGKEVATEDNGLQIIYDTETIARYPHLKQRQFWCWWVRSIILDEKYSPNIKANDKKEVLKADFPWPIPYGISSGPIKNSPEERKGILVEKFSSIELELLNGNHYRLKNDGKTKYFLADKISNKMGAASLHQVITNQNKVDSIVSNYFYVKSLKVVK